MKAYALILIFNVKSLFYCAMGIVYLGIVHCDSLKILHKYTQKNLIKELITPHHSLCPIVIGI